MSNSTPVELSYYDYTPAIVDTIREQLIVLTPDLHVLMANRTFYQTFHINPEEIVDHYFYEICNGQWNISSLRELLTAVFTENRPFYDFELAVDFENLGHCIILINGQQLRMNDGSQAILLTMLDITDRKHIETTLEISEIRYRRLFEAAQDGILLVDALTGAIINANPFIEDLLQYPQGELIEKKLWEIGLFKDTGASQLAFQELQTKKFIRYEDLPLETKLGKKINVEFVSNVYAVDGEIIIQCNIRDITDRKHIEEALSALRLELENRVLERTNELAQANENLQREILEREQAEARERNAVVEERTRIAREIHDTLAQGFTGIVIQLEAAEDAIIGEPEAVSTHILQARNLARESLAEARRSVWALRPLALEANDFAYAFLNLVNKLSLETGTQIKLNIQGVPRPINKDIEHHLLRIGQEAVTNALKHARTNRISVILAYQNEHAELSIEDFGTGFDVDAPAQPDSLGLRGIQERAEAFGGKFDISSELGKGTRVGILIPLPHNNGDTLGES